MRYTRISVASYVIAGVLALTAAAVGWARSSGGRSAPAAPVVTSEPEHAAPASPDTGAAVYARDCRSCHGQGEARGRRIPALREYAVTVFTSEGGREYLVDFMFDGRVRTIENGSVVFVETHPEYSHLSDLEVASVLNYMLTAWGNDALVPRGARMYTAEEVERRRGGV